MFSRVVIKKQRGRRALTGLAILSLLTSTFVISSTGLALTQTDFELDKNATADLLTPHLGTSKGQISSTTATSIDVCLRQSDPDGAGPQPITPEPIPAAPFTILIDSEQLRVTARSAPSNKTGGCSFGDPADSAAAVETWTVARGFNGSTAASHPGASDVTWMNATSVTGDDWADVHASVTADANDIGDDDKCIALGAVECTWLHDAFNVSVFTTGGSKDDLDIPNWRHTDSSVPPSDEILDAFAAKYDTGTRQTLYFGADRWSVNGAKDFGFWFFKTPVGAITSGPLAGTFSGVHSIGDILILGTFTQGGAVATIRVYSWVGTGGDTNTVLQTVGQFGDCVPGGGTGPGCNTVNNTTVPSPWAYQGSASTNVPNVIYAGGLLEGGIDLTAMGLTGCFSSFLAETRSSPSIGAQLKDFVLGNFESCGSTLVTTPGDAGTPPVPLTDSGAGTSLPDVSIGTGSVQVKDSAVLNVTGTTSFTGNLTFNLCGPIADPALCTSGGAAIGGTTAVTTNGTYSSAAATITEVGRYCWRADFDSTTTGVPDASDSSATECFEVLPVTPTLTTSATASVELGGATSDSATLSGTATQPGTGGGGTNGSINPTTAGDPADGTITFTLYKADCTTLASGTGTNPQNVTVSGNGTYGPVSFTPDAPGTYHWVASYDGSLPNTNGTNHNTACDDSDETVIVQQLQPTMDTAQRFVPNDSATVTVAAGVGDLDGTLVFKLYVDNLTCTGAADYETDAQNPLVIFDSDDPGDTTLSATVSSANTTAYAVDGTTFSWVAEFTSNNGAHLDVTSPCTNETSSISIDNGVTQPPAAP